jgi:AraC family transcriptional regulator of adaptative response/methylated-DNA-[protein]-cysteine methyltransferase
MPTDYSRVEKAINYLEENFQDQPSLRELADHLNMSSCYFQRVFKRWAGISPKRFLQFLTIEHAKKMLDENRSVLDAAYDSGLSGPGRLHDLFVTIDAITPGEYKKRGMGLEITYGIHATPFGECLLAVTERGICGLSFINGEWRREAVAALRNQWEGAILKKSNDGTKPYLNKIFARPGCSSRVATSRSRCGRLYSEFPSALYARTEILPHILASPQQREQLAMQ